jgi:hypothetical protein
MLGRIQASPLPGAPAEPSSLFAFRGVTFLFALLLAIFCLWLVFAELKRPRLDAPPIDREGAELVAPDRDAARSAATAGLVRGDLWAEAAFTFADLLWSHPHGDSAAGPELKTSLAEAHDNLDRAVRYAPTNAGIWLFAAELGLHYGWSSPAPAEALRMSYYTGPNELSLMPMRAQLATQLPALDTDLQQLAERDVRLLVAHQQQPAIIRAYLAATPSGKQLIEEVVGKTDPGFVEALRRGAD